MRAAMEKLLILMAAAAFDLSISAAAACTFSARCVAADSAGEGERDVVDEAGEASSAEMLLCALDTADGGDGGDGMCGVERFGEIILWPVCLSLAIPSFLGSISSVHQKLGLESYEFGLSSGVTVKVFSLGSLRCF